MAQALTSALPRFYLDCDFCDETYIRREINFVDHVRDPELADIYVLVTAQRTGSGGIEYRLVFEGRNAFEGAGSSSEQSVPSNSTDDERRRLLVQLLKMGILPFMADTQQFDRFGVNYEDSGEIQVDQEVSDPWNNWVFRINGGVDAELEESQSEFEVEGGIRAQRITESWKTVGDFEVEYRVDTFESDDIDSDDIRSTSSEWDADLRTVKSLDPHWSFGVLSDFRSSTFQNLEARYGLASAIEYNIFPWVESDRRIIAMAYFVGLQRLQYREETIFDKMEETLAYQAMRVEVIYEQPWGDVFARLEASQFLNDLSKYSVELSTFLDIRISQGLSLFVGGGAEIIRDQLFLPKGNASLEEILLRRRQLQTGFEIDISVGLSFTFGSIYNNAVNARL